MRPTSSITVALATLWAWATPSAAFWKGVNIGANNVDGSCKSQGDWALAFDTVKSLPGGFSTVRQFASGDCNTLANAVPAALSSGTKLLVGVWTFDENHYAAEKSALLAAINQHGSDWIAAISVGSETLYRKEQDPARLAEQINEVRGLVRQLGVNQLVGHVDTWNAWVDSANDAVIAACDFVGTDAYPYFQGATVEQSSTVFWDAVKATQDAVGRVKPNTPVWVTETGWPVSGDNFGNSVPSVANAQAYWDSVACNAFDQIDIFWYAYQDYTSSPSFGLIDANRNAIYNLAC